MSLLRDGTVIRKVSSLHHQTQTCAVPPKPPPSYETAPIENVTTVVEGLCATLTFTFKAVEGEVLQPSRHPHPGCVILCAEDNQVNQRACDSSIPCFASATRVLDMGLYFRRLRVSNAVTDLPRK